MGGSCHALHTPAATLTDLYLRVDELFLDGSELWSSLLVEFISLVHDGQYAKVSVCVVGDGWWEEVGQRKEPNFMADSEENITWGKAVDWRLGRRPLQQTASLYGIILLRCIHLRYHCRWN